MKHPIPAPSFPCPEMDTACIMRLGGGAIYQLRTCVLFLPASPQGVWSGLWPEDSDHTYPLYVNETLDPHVWGGQQQILVGAHLWSVSIHVQTPFGAEHYGQGPTWHLVYATHSVGHYDVFDPGGL